jgi:hypothetical protein
MVWRRGFCKKELLDQGGGENFKIEQFFSSLKVVFERFVLNSISLDYSNGFA